MISRKVKEHLLEVYLAPETELVFTKLNSIDKQSLAGLTDKDIELFINDRNSRACLLLGGYIANE